MSRAAALLHAPAPGAAVPATGPLLTRRPIIQRSCAAFGPGKSAESERAACDDAGARGPVQARLTISPPNDPLETQADEVADRVLRMPADTSSAAVPRPGFAAGLGMQPGGAPLASAARAFFEPRFGHDLGHVRIHDGDRAGALAASINARAFTHGANIYFAPGHYDAASSAGRHLLAHELAHTFQQGRSGKKLIQRRLLATGAPDEIQRFIDLVEPAIGKGLKHDPATKEISPRKSLETPAKSPSFATALNAIMGNATQHSEVRFGAAPALRIAGFPDPRDMTKETEQQIDLNHIEAIEAGAPGSGLAILAHEIWENYDAHAKPRSAGVDLYPDSHRAAIAVESDVAKELVRSGRRVAFARTVDEKNTIEVTDYDEYFLVVVSTMDETTGAVSILKALRTDRKTLFEANIDGYEAGSPHIPEAGRRTVDDVVAVLRENPTATVRIEGFRDTTEKKAAKSELSEDRATKVMINLVVAGTRSDRCHTIGSGAARPVATNATASGRALNRRVAVTVAQPKEVS